jgi:hypothetical protein
MKKILLGSVMALGLAFASGAALAAPVLRVIIVDVRDLKAYLHEVDALRAEYKKANVPITLRAWHATFAGPDAGAVVVSVEVPDLATLAKVQDMQKSNTEIAATMQRIGALRHIVSDSLYEELGP